MDNNTRKLLNLTDESLIFNEDWLSREMRNNRSVNMIKGRLISTDRIWPQCGFSTCVKNGTYDRFRKESFYWYKEVIETNGESLFK